MPSSLLDVCRFTPAAGGTSDWAYSSAVQGYQGPTAAGAVNGAIYSYRAESNDLLQWEVGFGAYNSGTTTFVRTTVLFNSAGTTAKINFTTVPQVAIVALGEDLLSFNSAMSLTAAQQLQVRTNLGLSTEVGKVEWWPTTTLQPGRVKANGQSLLRTTYPILLAYLVRSGTATFTNASTTVGMALHALSINDPIKLFTSGGLPTNFTAGTHGLPTVGTNYFVKTIIDANNVTLSATVGGTAISAGSAGSGTHTWVNAPSGDGDGSTTFTVPDLRGNFPRGWNDDAAIDANRTIGDLQSDAMQGHFHSAVGPTVGSGVVAGSTLAQGANTAGISTTSATNTIGSPTTDGTNGTPRTAGETRPRNVSLMATIRYAA